MHRFFTITLALLLVNVSASPAQELATQSQESSGVLFGIKSGVNISTFSASINSESRAKAGLALGIYLKSRIGPKLFFRPELYYSNQGQKDNYIYPYGGPSIGSTTTNMHYLNVPLLLELGNKACFQFGGQIGILLTGKEKGTIASVEVENNMNDVMTTADFAVVVGAGYSLSRHINSGIRVNYGISNIYLPDEDSPFSAELPKVHNRVLHFYVAYSF